MRHSPSSLLANLFLRDGLSFAFYFCSMELTRAELFTIINGAKPLQLCGLDLSGANLDYMNLYKANLHGANLSGCSLRGTYLYGATLTNADLSGCDVTAANFIQANLQGAKLDNVTGAESTAIAHLVPALPVETESPAETETALAG